MAISKAHYQMLRELKRRGILPPQPKLLEIGQANYYGDMDPREMLRDVDEFVPFEADYIRESIEKICSKVIGDTELFELARLVYKILVEPDFRFAVDAGGESDAFATDLNRYCDVIGNYKLIINHGTAEHIFNIANVFRLMHRNCGLFGLMIHELPFIGWIDHGFYSVQPTLIYDLAAANQYEIEFMALEDIAGQQWLEFTSREQLLDMVTAGGLPPNLLIYCALRKTTAAAFCIPMQGYYAESISQKAKEAWVTMR